MPAKIRNLSRDWPDEYHHLKDNLRNVHGWRSTAQDVGFPSEEGSPYLLGCEDGGPLMGVELEVSTTELCSKFTLATPFPAVWAKSDSSISSAAFGRMGFELVSVPADLAHQKVIWSNIFKNTRHLTEVCRDAQNTCGLHIHFDVETTFQDQEHLRRFALFFANANKQQRDFLIAYSQRSDESFERYSNTPSRTVRELFDADWPTFVARLTRGDSGNPVATFTRHGTVELRLFRGIWNFAYMLSCFEMAEAVIEWTKDCDRHDIEHSGAPQAYAGTRFFNWLKEEGEGREEKWKYLFQSISSVFKLLQNKEAKEIQKDVERFRNYGASEGSVFRTRKGAEYALLHTHNKALKLTEKGGNYIIEWDPNSLNSITGEGEPSLAEALHLIETNLKEARVEEIDDDELEAFVNVA